MRSLDAARALVDRMVRSPLNYWALMVFDGAGAAALVAIGAAGFGGSVPAAVVLAFIGFGSWTLLEYCLHRFIMHGPPSMARVGHAHHHADPTALISAPFFLVFLVAFGLWLLARPLLPSGVPALVLGGTYVGYNVYTWIHHVEHRWESVVSRVGFLRRHEALHHTHHVQQNVNFGVTTLFWDRVFGTFATTGGPARRPTTGVRPSRAR